MLIPVTAVAGVKTGREDRLRRVNWRSKSRCCDCVTYAKRPHRYRTIVRNDRTIPTDSASSLAPTPIGSLQRTRLAKQYSDRSRSGPRKVQVRLTIDGVPPLVARNRLPKTLQEIAIRNSCFPYTVCHRLRRTPELAAIEQVKEDQCDADHCCCIGLGEPSSFLNPVQHSH